MKKTIFLLVALISLIIIGCGKSAPDATQDVAQGQVQSKVVSKEVPVQGFEDVEEKIVNEAGKAGESKVIDVIAKKWEFVPSTIEVNQGDNVELNVKSIEGTHGFSLPDYDINERLPLDKTVQIKFVANKKGTFTFACSVPCGSGHGSMIGKLIVR